jgi:hypothetical protein
MEDFFSFIAMIVWLAGSINLLFRFVEFVFMVVVEDSSGSVAWKRKHGMERDLYAARFVDNRFPLIGL